MVQSKIEAEKELEEQRIADLERKYGPETVARIRERQQQTNDEFAENFNIPPFSAKSGQIKASILAEEKEAVMAERRKRTQAIEAKTEKEFFERQKQNKAKAEAEAKKLAQQENRKNIISEIDAQIESVQRERSGLDSAGYDPRYMTGKDEFGNKTPQWFEKNLGDKLEEGASSGVGSSLWEYLDYIPGFNMGKSVTPVKDNQRKQEAKNTLKNLRAAKAAALHLSDPDRYPAPFGLTTEEANNYLESKTGFNYREGKRVGKNRAQQETQAGNYANSKQEFLDRQGVIDIGYEGGMIVPRALAAAATGPSLWLGLLTGLGDAGLGYAASGKDKEGALQDASFQGGLELLMAAAGPALGPIFKKALAQVPIETLSKNVDFSAMFKSVPGIRQMVERATEVSAERSAGNLARNKALVKTLRQRLGYDPTPSQIGAFQDALGVDGNVEGAIAYVKQYASPRADGLASSMADMLSQPVEDPVNAMLRDLGVPTTSSGASQITEATQATRLKALREGGLEAFDATTPTNRMPQSFKQAPPPVPAPNRTPTGYDIPDNVQLGPAIADPLAPQQGTAIFIPDDYRPTTDDFGGSLLDKMKNKNVNKPLKYNNRGGIVYANNGALIPYRPQGTDTVPAMLTPGEFVVNRNATSQYLPVLRAINSGYNTHGQMVNHLARGGVAGSPQYLQNGGLAAGGVNNGVSVNSQIGGIEELKAVVNQLNEAISGGTENMTNVATQISNTSQSLASGAQSLNEAGTNIPTQITQQQRLTVDHAGIPQNIGAEFGKSADYAIGQADARSAQQLNDLNTANEGSLGLPPPNNNSTIR
jgi:hypothetical protein